MLPFPLNVKHHFDVLLPVLEANASITPSDFALRIKPSELPIPVADVAHLLDCYQRARDKFPNIHRPKLLYTRKALEQSSSEALVKYKSNLIQGDIAVDLTGGLGMDTFALSGQFKKVIYVEKDPNVLEIARHNHEVLGCQNITYVCEDAETWLNSCSGTKFDLMYIDPSRRNEHGRQFLLKDCEPDVRMILPQLYSLTKKLVVKVSPLYDITQITRELPDIVTIEVISVHNEVKEILVHCTLQEISEEREIRIKAVRLDKLGQMISMHDVEIDQSSYAIETAEQVGNYLYEPDVAIIKAGITTSVGSVFNLQRVSDNSIYLTSEEFCPIFPGKSYEVSAILPYKSKHIAAYLWERQLEAVHIHKRDFPLKPEELFKKFNLRMGDQAHLFFTKDADGALIMICAQLVEV